MGIREIPFVFTVLSIVSLIGSFLCGGWAGCRIVFSNSVKSFIVGIGFLIFSILWGCVGISLLISVHSAVWEAP